MAHLVTALNDLQLATAAANSDAQTLLFALQAVPAQPEGVAILLRPSEGGEPTALRLQVTEGRLLAKWVDRAGAEADAERGTLDEDSRKPIGELKDPGGHWRLAVYLTALAHPTIEGLVGVGWQFQDRDGGFMRYELPVDDAREF